MPQGKKTPGKLLPGKLPPGKMRRRKIACHPPEKKKMKKKIDFRKNYLLGKIWENRKENKREKKWERRDDKKID